jgi:hypothetical protein
MSSRDSIVTLFNKKADEFFKDLSVAFPHIQQFKTFKTAFTMMQNLDERKPITVFNTYVYAPYRDIIMKKEESFFLNNEFDLSGSSKQEHWQDFIHNLRVVWATLDEDNKSTIWKYFQVLILLNEKYLNST